MQARYQPDAVRLVSSLMDSVQDSLPRHLLLKPLKHLSAAADTSWQGRSMFLQSDKQAECVGRLPAQGLFHCPVTRGATHSMAMNWKKPHQNCLTLRLWKAGSTIYCIRSAPAQRCRPTVLLCVWLAAAQKHLWYNPSAGGSNAWGVLRADRIHVLQ